jgi:hypothetical protein
MEGETDEDQRDAEEAEDETGEAERAGDETGGDTDEAAQQEATQEYQKQHTAWSRRMGELLGQLPWEGDGVNLDQRRFSVSGGGVTRTGLMVQVDVMAFDRLVDGPPALVRWLCSQDCVGLKYQFSMGF